MSPFIRKTLSVCLVVAFILSFIIFLMEILIPRSQTDYYVSEYDQAVEYEKFDPSLLRINSIDILEEYCDSLFNAQDEAVPYPFIVDDVVRKKFRHGYSYYGKGHNIFASIIAPLTGRQYDAIVIPDDIVKRTYAACSQQAIIAMELLKRKKYDVRKVGFYDAVTDRGHFSYEVFYNKGWHFFDPNREPDMKLLQTMNMPMASYLAKNPELTKKAYAKEDPLFMQRLFSNYKYGKPNVFPAPFAIIFQYITKFMSYFFWIILLFLNILNYRHMRRDQMLNTRSLPTVSGKKSYRLAS